MKIIKVIDLLNKIANEEELPKKIRYFDRIWELDKYENDYYDEEGDSLNDTRLIGSLNDEVEIIEEIKLPEKLGKIEDNDGYIDQYDVIKIGKKVDEIIDYLKSKEKGE